MASNRPVAWTHASRVRPAHPPHLPCAPAQVFYNNLLSMPLIFMLMAGGGELHSLWEQPDLTNPRFQLVAALSGLLGFGIR